MSDDCSHCGHAIPLEYTFCPHCGIELKCPNVRLADAEDQVAELDKRFRQAQVRASDFSYRAELDALESHLTAAKAVLSCSRSKLLAIAKKPGVFANYYDLMSLQFLPDPVPGKPNWNQLRPQVEIELVGSHMNLDRLHYACLSIDGESLPHYGECTVVLKEQMIGHRASLFEENSAVFFMRHGPGLPAGTRCSWKNRAKLGVAKLADSVAKLTESADNGPTADDFSKLVLRAATDPLDDAFIEVQVFGEMTIHTFERITERIDQETEDLVPQTQTRERSLRGSANDSAIKELCNKANIEYRPI